MEPLRRLFGFWVYASCVVLGLGGCVDSADSSQPWETSGVGDATRVAVLPVEGAQGGGGMALAAAMALALSDAQVLAITAKAGDERHPTVTGHIEVMEERSSIVWVNVSWEVRSGDGMPLGSFQHESVLGRALWQHAAPEAIRLIVDDAVPSIASFIKENLSAPGLAEAAVSPAQIAEPEAKATAVASVLKDVDVEVQTPRSPPSMETFDETTPEGNGKTTPESSGDGRETFTHLVDRSSPTRESPQTEPASSIAADNEGTVPSGLSLAPPGPPPSGLLPFLDTGQADVIEMTSSILNRPPVFLMRPVKGAPGDGNLALSSAMQLALRARDVVVTEDPRQADYAIQGVVEVGPPFAGRQWAKIVWSVLTLDGLEMGTATQENAITEGSLDGPWGHVAAMVSDAAVDGIQQLFKEHFSRSAPANRQTSLRNNG